MNTTINERTIIVARFIVENACTVRRASKKFGIAKSTIHKDITERLPYIDRDLYREVKKILEINLKERHLRGGESTRQMYLKRKALSDK